MTRFGAWERLWQDYGQHHQASGNQLCHAIGIPLIMAGILAMLWPARAGMGGLSVSMAPVLAGLAAAAYVVLDVRLGSAMALLLLALTLLTHHAGWHAGLACFVLGWIFQFVGHGIYEKQRPAFYQNLTHLVVGPLWVLNHFLHWRS